MTLDIVHYLTCKGDLDKRSRSRRCWDVFVSNVGTNSSEPLRIVEFGPGLGFTAEALVEHLGGHAASLEVSLVDIDASVLHAVTKRLKATLGLRHAAASAHAASGAEVLNALTGSRNATELRVETVRADFEIFAGAAVSQEAYDAVLAESFLDLFHVPTAMDAIFACLKPGGAYHFGVNYDGLTRFIPQPVDDELRQIDASVLSAYNAAMDGKRHRGRPVGGSHTGSDLLAHLAGLRVFPEAIGGSDWIVAPTQPTGYADGHAQFIEYLLNFIATEMEATDAVAADAHTAWRALRQRQLEAGELTLIVHQIDVSGRKPSGGLEAGP